LPHLRKVQKTMTEDRTARTRRRQAAILVAGYSRLLPGDEKQNFAELRSFLTRVIRPQIAEFGRNIFTETVELVLADVDECGNLSCNPSNPTMIGMSPVAMQLTASIASTSGGGKSVPAVGTYLAISIDGETLVASSPV
jgi:hypothetical protein